jgi:peptide/nickel transport system substrate-binding protein
MTSINVIDTYTVRINLVRYSNALLADLSTFAGLMVSPLSIIKHSEEWAREHAVGTGPFVFDSLQRGDLLKFKRFDGYWQKGKPYLDGIEFRFINDANKAKETFLDGEAHLYHFFASKYAKNARAIASKGYEVVSLYCGLVGLLPDSNNLDSPFSDKRVREALEYAIDRPAIAKELGYGYWVALEQSFPQGHLAYNPNVKGRQYNPDKARKLLAEAGYSKGFTIKVPVEGKSISEDEMHSIQRYLKEVGIIAEPLFLTPDEYGKMKNEGWENGFTLTTIIPVHGNIAGHFERELRPNYSTYISMRRADEWGDTILKATATDNLEIHKKYVQKLTKIIYDDAMFVPLFVTSVVVAKRGGVHNDGNCLVSRMHWTPENAWLSE